MDTPDKNTIVWDESHNLAINAVEQERVRQEQKWGEQNHNPDLYLVVLMEEIGEFAQASLQTRFGGSHGGQENMRIEAVHVAAVALAIVECLYRDKWSWNE